MAKLIEKRPRISRNISTLTLGTGKVSKLDSAETVELHFNHKDYDNLIATRTRPKVLFALNQSIGEKETKEAKATPRRKISKFEVSLPKTYLTRQGSMVLYSDRNAMRDKHHQSPSTDESSELDVTGQSIERPNTSASNSQWIQLVGRQKCPPRSAWSSNSISCREKERYIKSRASDRSRAYEDLPYSWNYAVSPAKIMNPRSSKDLETVKGLSEAVLSYKKQEPNENGTDKYLELIRQKWKSRTEIEKQQLILSGKLFKATDWTRDWINMHRMYLRESQKKEEIPEIPAPKPKRKTRKGKRPSRNAYDNDNDKGRVPANTPMSRSRRNFTRSSQRIKTGVTV